MSLEMSTYKKSRNDTFEKTLFSTNNTTNLDNRVSATLHLSFACAEKLYFTGIYRSSVTGLFFVKKGLNRFINRLVTSLQGFYLLLVSVALLKLQTNKPATATGRQIDPTDAFLLKFVSYSYLAACIGFWVSKATCNYFQNDVLFMLNSIFKIKKRERRGKLELIQNLQIDLSNYINNSIHSFTCRNCQDA